MEVVQGKSNRERLSIRFRYGFRAEVSIISDSNPDSNSKQAPIMVCNMSPSNLQFLSHLRFPVSEDYLVRITLKVDDWEFSLLGNIAWRRKEENQYCYGCALVPDRLIRNGIIHALNQQLREMYPMHHRIHEMYHRMSETAYETKRIDKKA